MDVEMVRYDGNSKFMWDGELYQDRDSLEAKKGEYEGNGFEARVFEQEGNFILYTRRVVKEIILDG